MFIKFIKYRICKSVWHKIERKKYFITKRAMRITLIELDKNSVHETTKKTKISHFTLLRIRKQTIDHVTKNDLSLHDFFNYENVSRIDRTHFLTVKKKR